MMNKSGVIFFALYKNAYPPESLHLKFPRPVLKFSRLVPLLLEGLGEAIPYSYLMLFVGEICDMR